MAFGGNAQTAVLQEQELGYPGSVWSKVDSRTAFNEEASAGMLPGTFVATDPSRSDGRGALLLTAATDPIHGLIIRDYQHAPGSTGYLNDDGSLKPGAAFDCLTSGRGLAIAETTTCAPGDKVYVRCIANGGNTTIGAVTDTSDGGNTYLLPNAVFIASTTTLADGTKVAPISFSLPV